MKTSFDPATGVQLVWDSTSIKAAERCPRYYQYKLLQNWQPHNKSVHLWFGAHYATALETYHKLRASGEDFESAQLAVVREALVATWNTERNGPDTFDHNTKTRENLIRTIVWYLEEFRDDSFDTYLLEDNGKAAVELTFKFEVDNGIMFSGHMDRICTDPAGEIFVHDQKTTGTTLSPYYYNQFKPDSQFSMYTFAGKAIFNVPLSGVIIDAAQIAVGFTRFGRVPTYRTDAELDEWYDETLHLIERTQAYTSDGWFPRCPASCNNYGGCEFRDVCSRPPAVRDNFLKASHTNEHPRWDPVQNR